MAHTNEFIELRAQEVLRLAGSLSVPVDLERVADALEVRVHDEELESEVSGVLIVKGKERHILVNKAHHANRRRFTVAHELGQFCLHDDDGDRMFIDHQMRVYHRVGEANAPAYTQPGATTDPRQEREANMFAAALLMPAPLVTRAALERDMWDELDVTSMAKTFGVSEQAMSIRLQQLKVVSVDFDAERPEVAAGSAAMGG